MPQFNSVHLEHLIKLCCWKIKVEPNKRGFEVLIDKIKEQLGKNPILHVKYLENFSGKVKTAVKNEQQVSVQEDFIFELLQFCDYLSWIEFEEEIARIESYLNEYPSISKFEEASVIVLTTEKEADQLMPIVSFYPKILDVRVEIKQGDSNELNDIKECLDETAYVISYLSPRSSETNIHPLDPEKWSVLVETNRFVPVWIGNEKQTFSISGVSKRHLIIGKRGLLLSLIVLNTIRNKSGEVNKRPKRGKMVAPNQRIKNFKGIIANGDLNMTGGHLSLGDTNYYSEKLKKDGRGKDE